ncbi:MAG: hypothetical protein OXQ89_13790 [Rhodospirillaceae bacterium]|nr:hypothetical protein [Rhodospirillaceae bacterium]MDD9998808.1 hypothetical protein [Rhodospirillaceae bacterium]MDE0359659.1 hypothetical protein [Rhodospirillaceae bacterium]
MNHVQASEFGGLVRRAFSLFYRNFPLLCVIYLLPTIPVGLWSGTIEESNEPIFWVSATVDFFFEFIVSAALTLAVSEICVGNRPAVLATYGRLAEKAGRVTWTSILLVLIAMAGIAFVEFRTIDASPEVPPIVPFVAAVFAITYMIATFTYLMFAVSATVLERISGIEALGRSIYLVREYFWRNLGVVLVTLIPLVMATAIFTAGEGALFGFESLEGRRSLAGILIDELVFGIAVVPSLIAVVLLYFDCRVRKEQFNREQLALELAA